MKIKQILYGLALIFSVWSYGVLLYLQTTGRFAKWTESSPLFFVGAVFMLISFCKLIGWDINKKLRLSKKIVTLLSILYAIFCAFIFMLAFIFAVFSIFGGPPRLFSFTYICFIVDIPCITMLLWCIWGIAQPFLMFITMVTKGRPQTSEHRRVSGVHSKQLHIFASRL